MLNEMINCHERFQENKGLCRIIPAMGEPNVRITILLIKLTIKIFWGMFEHCLHKITETDNIFFNGVYAHKNHETSDI